MPLETTGVTEKSPFKVDGGLYISGLFPRYIPGPIQRPTASTPVNGYRFRPIGAQTVGAAQLGLKDWTVRFQGHQ